jgi:4-hydroxy-tetrahydrodipicolinate synthase
MQELIWSATPTPFLPDASLDDAGLERVVAQHRRLGVSGLFLGGTCGEGPFMPNAQRAELVRKVRRLAGSDLHLAVQVSDTSAARVRVNIAEAVDAGADSVVMAAPWLRPFVNRQFARRYFLDVLDRPWTVPVGIYILKQPPETGIDLELWAEIARHANVAYVKDSSMSEEYAQALVGVKAERPGLTLRTGYEFDVLSSFDRGYDGCLLGTAILNAGLLTRAIAALQAGDRETASSWQKRSNELLYDLFRPDLSSWMAGLKYALRQRGIFTTEFSHLAAPLIDDDRRRIDAALEREKEYL